MAKMTLEKLAVMVKAGFEDVLDRIASLEHGHTELKGGLALISSKATSLERGQEVLIERVTSLEHGQDVIIGRLSSLERGQEDMLLKMDNFAYKFEVVELKKRVSKAEGRLNRLESINK